MRALSIMLVIGSLVLCGCSNDEDSRASIEEKLKDSLAVGDSRSTIEEVLNKDAYPFSFDEFNLRYQVRIDPDEGHLDDRIIMVYIYVDDQMQFLRLEAKNSYTFF